MRWNKKAVWQCCKSFSASSLCFVNSETRFGQMLPFGRFFPGTTFLKWKKPKWGNVFFYSHKLYYFKMDLWDCVQLILAYLWIINQKSWRLCFSSKKKVGNFWPNRAMFHYQSAQVCSPCLCNNTALAGSS